MANMPVLVPIHNYTLVRYYFVNVYCNEGYNKGLHLSKSENNKTKKIKGAFLMILTVADINITVIKFINCILQQNISNVFTDAIKKWMKWFI